MSFDLFFQPCRFDGTTVIRNNPFTGQPADVPRNATLTSAELAAVRRLLDEAGKGPDEHGCWLVTFPDGGSAEIFGSNLEEGCMAALRGLTDDLVRFLHALLVAGDWVVVPATDEPLAIAASKSAMRGAPEDFPEVVVCASADELGTLLSRGVDAWREYRDRVLDPRSGAP